MLTEISYRTFFKVLRDKAIFKEVSVQRDFVAWLIVFVQISVWQKFHLGLNGRSIERHWKITINDKSYERVKDERKKEREKGGEPAHVRVIVRYTRRGNPSLSTGVNEPVNDVFIVEDKRRRGCDRASEWKGRTKKRKKKEKYERGSRLRTCLSVVRAKRWFCSSRAGERVTEYGSERFDFPHKREKKRDN